MRVFSQNKQTRVDEENPYWISFSDLMSALLVVFILAAVALIIQLTEIQKEIEKDKEKIEENIEQLRNAEKARKDILYEIKDELEKQNITVIIADNDSILRIPESTLTFRSNSDNIPQTAEDSIKIIGAVLHQAINKPFLNDNEDIKRFEFLDTIFIEGHTDGLISHKYKGNWGLSTNRAISLWEFWEANVLLQPSFNGMTNAFGQRLFSVSGYAETRRIQLIEETPEQRQKNRRIDIRFTVKRPSISQLEEIINQ